MPQSLRLSQGNAQENVEVSRKTVGSVTTQRTLNILHPDNEGGLYFEREDKTSGGISELWDVTFG